MMLFDVYSVSFRTIELGGHIISNAFAAGAIQANLDLTTTNCPRHYDAANPLQENTLTTKHNFFPLWNVEIKRARSG